MPLSTPQAEEYHRFKSKYALDQAAMQKAHAEEIASLQARHEEQVPPRTITILPSSFFPFPHAKEIDDF